MASVGERLLREHPELEIGEDFLYRDDTGEILQWNEDILGPRPESNNIAEVEEATSELSIEVEKDKKKAEIAQAAIEEMSVAYTSGVEGRDELQFEITRAVLGIATALLAMGVSEMSEITESEKLKAVVKSGGKAREKQVVIENAESIEEIEEVVWETTEQSTRYRQQINK